MHKTCFLYRFLFQLKLATKSRISDHTENAALVPPTPKAPLLLPIGCVLLPVASSVKHEHRQKQGEDMIYCDNFAKQYKNVVKWNAFGRCCFKFTCSFTPSYTRSHPDCQSLRLCPLKGALVFCPSAKFQVWYW